jgi:hypothetical protein
MPRILIFLLLLGTLVSPAQAREISRNALYGAIAYHGESGSSGFAVDRRNSREARIEALRQCGHPKCEIVARLRSDCGAVAKSARKIFTERGATRQEAETKALRRCGDACEIVVWACAR